MSIQKIARFTALWAQTQPSLTAFIATAITSFADAEDVLQKVAAAAVQKFDEYDASRPFLSWAIGIARYEILRHLRDRSADRHEFVAESLPHIASAFENLGPELDNRRAALSACLEGVQGRPRLILEQRYGEAMKTGAIAKAMGLSPGNVSVILRSNLSPTAGLH
jgi:RNA polymerase sigma-70 factor (ECF subfamily)